MDRRVRLHTFTIALLTFVLTVFILLLLSAPYFDFQVYYEQKARSPFPKMLDEELLYDHPESYEYCFEKARTTKPAQGKWIVEPYACSNDVNVVVMVKSSTDRNENRHIIRKTWGQNVQLLNGKDKRLIFRTIFIIGFSSIQSTSPINRYLQAENQKYKDILQVDIQDGLAVPSFIEKTLNGLRFLDKSCPNVSMILIADDDTILAPWLLFGKIAPIDDIIQNADLSYFGGLPFLMNIVPRRLSQESRITFPRDKYPCYSVPLYLRAFAMLISQKTMKRLLEETENYYSSLFIDDIYLSWLAYRLNLTFTEFPKQLYDGSCLFDNLMHSQGQYEIHLKHESVDNIAFFHQCDAPQMQIDIWHRLCESFVTNDSTVLNIHASYCDMYIERALI
uniref:Hexosyltransferase n=1 Tax=Romanomermis culicivorax TaxID=13658 RepID=A0A915L5H3_ROMCU